MVIIFLALLFQSCKNLKSDVEIYNENAITLLSYIVENEDLICDCVVQVDSSSLYEETILLMPNQGPGFKNKVLGVLEIKSEEAFEKSIALGKNFRFKPAMFNDKLKIINRKEVPHQFESLETEKSQNFIEKCPNFQCWISEPIFNKNFTKAIVSNEYGTSCFYNPPAVYFKFRGKWELSGESPLRF